MPSHGVRRGRGPWPSDNGLQAVQQWLGKRLLDVIKDDSERNSLIRWMLDECSSLSRADRIIQKWQASESELEKLSIWVERYVDGEPWQYIVGHAHFAGLKIRCDKRALIPRPETEELIHQALELVQLDANSKHILDIGTGTGCMALAWKSGRQQDDVWGLDASSTALELAAENAQLNGLSEVQWMCMDILNPNPDFPPCAFDLILSNPPYIPWRELPTMEPRVHEWEPHGALFVEDHDSLLFYRQIIELGAKHAWLVPDGWLCFECHAELTEQVKALFDVQDEWRNVKIVPDLQGKLRMVFAQKSSR